MTRVRPALLVLGLAACAACGDDLEGPLFLQEPECEGEAITPLAGQHQMLISFIEIGNEGDGFDLDRDGEVDNQLFGVSNLAREGIEAAFANFDVIAPIEFFDMANPAADDCVKFAVYLARYKLDGDGDAQITASARGDCNDLDEEIRRGRPEVDGNLRDDDCDGLADEVGGEPSTDAEDHDGDGVTIADGDCDDTRAEVDGEAEVCGDGLDNDCDGTADWGLIADQPACTPYDPDTPDRLELDGASLDGDGAPLVAFTSAEVRAEGERLILRGGPSIFRIDLPILGLNLDLQLAGATVEGELAMTPAGWVIQNGKLGGVIDAATADRIRGIEVAEIDLHPEDSLLDAVFGNVLGVFLGLPRSEDPEWSYCHVPDIDVDRDGLEAFCDSTPDDGEAKVDVCVDGDGTVVRDQDGKECTEALDGAGNPRFTDGISVGLNFETVPAQLDD